MITVINNDSTAVANLYEGKSLADACDLMVLETYEAVNEFNMDVLLTEHAYLYENACEIQYVTEAGEETKEGSGFKAKVSGLIDKVRTFISSIWQKFTDWIEERVADITSAIYKIGFNKKKFEEACKYANVNNIVIKGSKWILADDIDKAIHSIDGFYATLGDNKLYAPGEYFDTYAVKDSENSYEPMTLEQIKKAGEVVFESNKTVKEIKTMRNTMDKHLKDLKATALRDKSNDMAETIKKLDETLKSNSNVCKDKIKLYQKNLNANCAVVKDMVRIYNAYLKDEKKSELANSKAAQTLGKIKHNNPDWYANKDEAEKKEKAPAIFNKKEEAKNESAKFFEE